MDINVTVKAPEVAQAISELAGAIKGLAISNVTNYAASLEATAEPLLQAPQLVQAPVVSVQPPLPMPVAPVVPVAAPVQTPLQQAPVQQPVYGQPVQTGPVAAPVQYTQPVPVAPVAQAPMYAQPIQQQARVSYAQPAIQQAPVPVAAPTYSVDQLATAGMQLVDAGRRDAVLQLLTSFGVSKLTDIPKERYAEYAMQLRQLGAKI